MPERGCLNWKIWALALVGFVSLVGINERLFALQRDDFVLLCLQILLGALVFACGLWVCLRGYYGAGDALDGVLNTGRGWPKVLLWGCVAFGGAGLSAGVVTYGLSNCAVC